MQRLQSGLLAIVFMVAAGFYLGYLSGQADEAQRVCLSHVSNLDNTQTGDIQC